LLCTGTLYYFLGLQVERLKKIEMASDMDEILKEEIREYKETLTCPSCKVSVPAKATFDQCFGSVSGLHPDSMGSLDPDPDSQSGFKRTKMTQKVEKS
jgi:hypothetical protein